MRQWVGVLARLLVGIVDLVAGLAKFPDPAGNVRQVRAFQILPESVVPTVGHALPTAEIIIGVALILGLLTRLFGVLSALFFIAFIIGISAAWARGLEINCGCFGSHGVPANPQRQYAIDIARDVGLLACSLWLMVWPRTRLALDTLLFPHHERLADGDESEETVEV
ncbi:MAG TPA: MauE/DoxX family redox-associated membrane protein [Nocardioides sp.]|uniref:MauE/DoxX family redox-associated membrane protein n=1 Tax=Nocardioides sp. TaxID=35761 RepID=UPI002F42AF56